MTRSTLWLLLVALLALGADTDRDARGWHKGSPAARTAQILAPLEAVPVELPAFVADRVTRTTFLYYFSPTCPHCRATIPEVIALHGEIGDRVDFLGVAAATATARQISAFNKEFDVPFPVLHDAGRDFAEAVGARSTPTVVIVEPRDGGFVARDAYYPWRAGAGLMVKLSLWPEQPFSHFKPGTYLGPQACGACHEDELLSWTLTHHAIAYRTLYMRDKAEDPKCVGCHVTGLGQPSGFVMGDHGSMMANVTCESCHSPGGPHDGEAVDAREACAGCHDAEHSIAFSLEKGLPHIDHYLASHLTDAEQEARWQALVGGEAERPLLAFPEGANVGAAACQSCHPAEVQAWQGSVHGHAMERLDRKQQKDPDCVRCHATPSRTAMGTRQIEDYRVDESVGCESCHGPGERHVASPTPSNILGLGASCPECVIEEVCTSCHTPRWDADWSLEERLGAVKGHGPAR
ncbi:MAG: redoxin domain-containing protein [Alphaproteobacteria bacterium]|nr:redoxin domain-containing protein [Alphaproteobacteria bacterium]